MSDSRFLSPRPRPDLAQAPLPGTRHRNSGRNAAAPGAAPSPGRAPAARASPGSPGAVGEAATSPRSPLGARRAQPGFHYITGAAPRAIGCPAGLPANRVRICKSSLSQRFLWLGCMQTDVIARVGVGGGGSAWKLAARRVWRLGIRTCPSQSRGARRATRGECPRFSGPFSVRPKQATVQE